MGSVTSYVASVPLVDEFTSTGKKFAHHKDALEGLHTDKPRPIVSHIMLTDRCNHRCAFCSVQSRDGDTLEPTQIAGYLNQLVPLGLKAVILSGGGNPILYRSHGTDFDGIVDLIKSYGLEIGLITNGMPMQDYLAGERNGMPIYWNLTNSRNRLSWKTVQPQTLDKLTWIRISMAGLDHDEREVFVPHIDPAKTTLGFSYVFHDIYYAPDEPHHGKVSTEEDLIRHSLTPVKVWKAEDRIEELTQQIGDIVRNHNPTYVRLLPNCLEPSMIKDRCAQLQKMADAIDPKVVFVQYKPPAAPPACYLGYLHPVLNCDGYVYPCDSCVLNKAAEHKFAVPWRICRWDEIGEIYQQPVRSLIKDTKALCPGCVFTKSNELLIEVRNGMELPEPQPVVHPNFV